MIPKILYKYRSLAGEYFKYTQDIFLRKRIFLPPASLLNDPWEGLCQVTLPISPSPPQSGATYFQMGEDIRKRAYQDSVRVGSFSALPTNPLMWAHYADGHQGICIGFSTNTVPELSQACPIRYQSELPTVHVANDPRNSAYLKKSADWTYEEEWRIVVNGSGYLPIGTDAIMSVILGARISAEDREWVCDWLRYYDGTVALSEAQFSRDEYTMEIEETNETRHSGTVGE